jgi:hypothetical protein
MEYCNAVGFEQNTSFKRNRKLQKIGLILLMVIVAGCSVTRRGGDRYTGSAGRVSAAEIMTHAEELNITAQNFFIQKAEIKITSEEGTESFLGNLKYEKPDKYLLSLRSRTGIEGARILLSDDTIMINDRINRVFYHGSSQALRKKYGISAALLPVVLGDFIKMQVTDQGSGECREGILNTSSIINGVKINYTIDCKLMKAVSIIPDNSMNMPGIEIRFSDFFKRGDVIIPGNIEVTNLNDKSTIEIIIVRLEFPWTGTIEFIPGSNYEIQKIP